VTNGSRNVHLRNNILRSSAATSCTWRMTARRVLSVTTTCSPPTDPYASVLAARLRQLGGLVPGAGFRRQQPGGGPAVRGPGRPDGIMGMWIRPDRQLLGQRDVCRRPVVTRLDATVNFNWGSDVRPSGCRWTTSPCGGTAICTFPPTDWTSSAPQRRRAGDV